MQKENPVKKTVKAIRKLYNTKNVSEIAGKAGAIKGPYSVESSLHTFLMVERRASEFRVFLAGSGSGP